MICKWCNGTGSIAIEPGCSTRYRCTDCNGTGSALIEDGDDPERGRPEEDEKDDDA